MSDKWLFRVGYTAAGIGLVLIGIQFAILLARDVF